MAMAYTGEHECHLMKQLMLQSYTFGSLSRITTCQYFIFGYFLLFLNGNKVKSFETNVQVKDPVWFFIYNQIKTILQILKLRQK